MYRNKHKNNPSITSPEIARKKYSQLKNYGEFYKSNGKNHFLKFDFTCKYKVSDKSECKLK